MGSSIALVGEETLLGREIKEVMESREPQIEIEGYAANGEGNFTEQDGESVYVKPFEASAIKGKVAVILAGSSAGALKAYDLAKAVSDPPLLIDCAGWLENQPEARIAASLNGEPDPPASWLLVSAHPAALVLAMLLTRASKYRRVTQVVANIFEPASERGKKGLGELHQQTNGLLAFKSLDREVFDAQLAFNMLPRLGEEAVLPLIQVEQRIDRELATILSRTKEPERLPLPSVRLIQAPVFHGYSFSVWVEFESNADVQAIEEALASAQIEIRQTKDEAPNNAGAAGQSGLIAGDIRVDRNNPRAAWLWAAGDNLRLMADATVEVLHNLVTEAR